MKPLRLAVIGIAGVAGLAAVMLSGQNTSQTEVVQAPDNRNLTEVLVAKADLPVGTAVVDDEQLTWAKWPQDLANNAMILRTARPDAMTEFKGAIVRQAFFMNEPIREEKLIKANGTGFLSAILPSGKRALAITIDGRGSSSAGGFILPNDHVDILLIVKDEDASQRTGKDVFASTTLLSDIRVLAIGQNIQEKNGEKVVVGETATLELDPPQTETINLAQRTGSLALALRSLRDFNKPEPKRLKSANAGVTIIRFGVPQEITK